MLCGLNSIFVLPSFGCHCSQIATSTPVFVPAIRPAARSALVTSTPMSLQAPTAASNERSYFAAPRAGIGCGSGSEAHPVHARTTVSADSDRRFMGSSPWPHAIALRGRLRILTRRDVRARGAGGDCCVVGGALVQDTERRVVEADPM